MQRLSEHFVKPGASPGEALKRVAAGGYPQRGPDDVTEVLLLHQDAGPSADRVRRVVSDACPRPSHQGQIVGIVPDGDYVTPGNPHLSNDPLHVIQFASRLGEFSRHLAGQALLADPDVNSRAVIRSEPRGKLFHQQIGHASA